MYYESPPGLQFLHAVTFDSSVDGGESVLMDAFALAERFRTEHPQHFQTLTRIPLRFQKVCVSVCLCVPSFLCLCV